MSSLEEYGYGMCDWKRIDQLLTHLKRRQTQGGLTYRAAVDGELLISTFEHIRATMIADDNNSDCPNPPALSERAFNELMKGLTE